VPVRHRALDLLLSAVEEERSALDRVGCDQPGHPVGVEGAGEEIGPARDVVTRERATRMLSDIGPRSHPERTGLLGRMA
jgi:hypothetical protein